ncbi:MAG TPA: hypothetical protein VGC53_15340 [Vicinamibacteria bacterium]
MRRPLMIVVGGPAGSGKSTAFPVSDFGVDPFNIDDRAAELNGGSYRSIPPEIRARANQECEVLHRRAHPRRPKLRRRDHAPELALRAIPEPALGTPFLREVDQTWWSRSFFGAIAPGAQNEPRFQQKPWEIVVEPNAEKE